MGVKVEYFDELKEQITNIKKWNKGHFVVFNHEAGTGKSTSTHKILGEMAKEHSHKVLYVQKFSKNKELEATVQAINLSAGKNVAASFTGLDTPKAKIKKLIAQYQVLCVTHNMYIQICKGEHRLMIEDRGILIIDEYPDLLEKITISSNEVALLWWSSKTLGVLEIDELATMLRDLKDEYDDESWNKRMIFLDFQKNEYQKYRKAIKVAQEKVNEDKVIKAILKKFSQLFEHGGFLFEDAFHTFDGEHQFKLLDNNIILDANAGFDYRYWLSSKFVVNHQEKLFDYKKQTFNHIDVKTTKTALKRKCKFEQGALSEISLNGKRGVLFITEKSNEENLENEIITYFSKFGNTLEDIGVVLKCQISIDYFGNIIGVNTYRDYDVIVLLKTPNYDYLTYALTYFYYRSMDKKPIGSIELFSDEEVENIRRTVVAGELYQAIKRINRDNSQCADIYVFGDYHDAIDEVREQLPNIQYVRRSASTKAKEIEGGNSKREENSKASKLKLLLIEAKEASRRSIKKQELRDKLDIKSAGNLAKEFKKIETFLVQHNIMITKQQEIIFIDNIEESKQTPIISA